MTGSCFAVHDDAMSAKSPFSDDDLRRHVLQRLTFGPTGRQMSETAGTSPTDLLDELLAATPVDVSEPELGSEDDYQRAMMWWLEILLRPDAAVHERMVWFWHTHLTSSIDKSAPNLMVRQNMLLRKHAIGNFRTLMQEITIDAAMLYWLDGAYSTPDSPNENYGRELMELFTLGRDAGYTEDDVHSAAIALAGWWVDGDNGDEVKFDDSVVHPVQTLLGERVRSAEDVVNVVCDHQACAPFVAGRMYEYFHGVAPADDVREELGSVFRNADLEIRPLLEAILRHPTFFEHVRNRPRTALEWFIGLLHLYERDEIDVWPLYALGQVPFGPPNVAGWPGHERWVSVGAELTRAQTAWDYVWQARDPDADDPVAVLIERSGLALSEESRAALNEAFGYDPDDWEPFRIVAALLTMTPEFNVA